jgi:hypothetical protein
MKAYVILLSIVLTPGIASAAKISGIVFNPNGNPAKQTAVAADNPLTSFCAFCASQDWTETDENGEFELTVPDGEYVLFAEPYPPLYRDWQVVDASEGDVTGLEFRLRAEPVKPIVDAPPNAALIDIGTPDESGQLTFTGHAGATESRSHLMATNLSTGHIGQGRATEDGGFSLTMPTRAGHYVMIKSDPLGYQAGLFEFFHPPNFVGIGGQTSVNPGTIIRVPDSPGENPDLRFSRGGKADFFHGHGEAPPMWTFEGQVNALEFQPGEELTMTGEMRYISPVMDTVEAVDCDTAIKLEMLSDQNGEASTGRHAYYSHMLTTTGLPIERYARFLDESLDGHTLLELRPSGPGTFSAPVDASLQLPSSLPAGYYLPYLRLCWLQSLLEIPPIERLDTLDDDGISSKAYLPIIKVGDPDPPRLLLTLLTDITDNGSRGKISREDRVRWGLSPRITTVSQTLVIPRVTPLGTHITYRLEPYAPQVSMGDRTAPLKPKIPFRFPSGKLTVRIIDPDGKVRTLGPAPFKQSRVKSISDENGQAIAVGGGNISDLYQLSTMDPQFEVEFELDGRHEIIMEAEIDDIWGRTWRGGGSYEVWLARRLVVDTTIMPGLPFEVGDDFLAGANLFPAVPAKIVSELTIDPNSDPDDRVVRTQQGRANLFGQYHPASGEVELTQPGEYRFDIAASWEDEDGNLWMGSRTFGGVIAPPDSEITAHGRRGIDTEPDIGQAWYLRSNTGVEIGNNHLNLPFFRGDIVWVENNDAITTTLSFDEPDNTLSALMLPRVDCCFQEFDGAGSWEDRVAVGEIPLFSSRPDKLDPHFDPSQVDLWAYSYRSIQRPMVRVREFVSEDFTDSPYWRFDSTYMQQVGMGEMGDLPNDIKFMYGGVVLRGSALQKPQYAIYGSLAAILPPDDKRGGSRVFPPFQGNGGGPSGGPIITDKHEDIDLLINVRGVRPGSIFEVGDTFSMSGVFGPTLPAKLSYEVQRPDGTLLNFRENGGKQANLIGHYYHAEDDFVLNQPGVWTVDLEGIYDGMTSAGQTTIPYPTGGVLGTKNGQFQFYVTDSGVAQLPIDLPEYSILPPSFDAQGIQYRLNIQTLLPDDYTLIRAHATTMMPGYLLESYELNEDGVYQLDIMKMAAEVPNLDTRTLLGDFKLADALTISLYVEAEDGVGNPVHMGRIVNIRGDKIFALNVSAPEEDPFQINAGLNDAWVHAGAANQGMFVTVFPSFELMFAAWFTFDSVPPGGEVTAVVGAPDQRWVTALGPYSGTTASLKAEMTTGGSFNSSEPVPVQDTNYGTLDIDFSGCNSADVNFNFPTAGETGSFTVNRVLTDNVAVCDGIVNGEIVPTALSPQEQAQKLSSLIRGTKPEAKSATFMINSGLNDAWVNPDANFQGMFLTVFPELELMFAAWFVFDSEAPPEGTTATFGGPDQRWLTALGSYSGTTATLNVENTTGGSFNNTTPAPTQNTGYGTMNIDFTDCNNATVTYNIPSATQTGNFNMTRVLDDNVGLCEVLSAQ